MQEITRRHQFSAVRCMILAFLFIMAGYILPANSSALIGIEEGDVPEAIILKNLKGETINASSHFGKSPVIVVFWKLTKNDAFLNYSLDELQFLNDYYDKYHNKSGLEIYAIYIPTQIDNISEDEISQVQSLIDSNRIKFPVLIDNEFKLFRTYGIIALPSTVMVGKGGKIDFIYSSFPIAGRSVIAERIVELVGAEGITRKKQIKKKVDDVHSHRFYNYAVQMYKRGLLEQSLSAVNKSLDNGPNYAWAHNLKGIILWKKGISDLAAKEFRRAMELDRESNIFRINYTILLTELEQYSEAEDMLINLSDIDTDLKISAHHLLGTIYKKTGRNDKAIRELESAADLFEKIADPPDMPTYSKLSSKISVLNDLSTLYNIKGSKTKALEILQKALDEALGFNGTGHRRSDLMLYE